MVHAVKAGDLVRRLDFTTLTQVGIPGLIVGYLRLPDIGHYYPRVIWTDGAADSPAWHTIEVVTCK